MPEKHGDDKYKKIIATAKKNQVEQDGVELEEELIQLVVCTLAGAYYAFYGSCIKRILSYIDITFVPGCPDYILGIINVRGDIESVININNFVGLSESSIGSRTRIMIAEAGGMRSGVLVDSVEDVIDVPVTSIYPAISTMGNATGQFVEGELNYKDSSVTVFGIEKIFGRIHQQ